MCPSGSGIPSTSIQAGFRSLPASRSAAGRPAGKPRYWLSIQITSPSGPQRRDPASRNTALAVHVKIDRCPLANPGGSSCQSVGIELQGRCILVDNSVLRQAAQQAGCLPESASRASAGAARCQQSRPANACERKVAASAALRRQVIPQGEVIVRRGEEEPGGVGQGRQPQPPARPGSPC